jgi:hypothetical protein
MACCPARDPLAYGHQANGCRWLLRNAEQLYAYVRDCDEALRHTPALVARLDAGAVRINERWLGAANTKPHSSIIY